MTLGRQPIFTSMHHAREMVTKLVLVKKDPTKSSTNQLDQVTLTG